MRKYYLDNIRWMTVVLVVIYHVIYMYNAEGIPGVVGSITDQSVQYQDLFQYAVYPWFMPLLFIVSGICARYYLEQHTDREFIRNRTTKLLVPATIGLFAFQFIQGYINMSISNAFESHGNVPKGIIYPIMAISGIGVLWYIQLLWVLSVLLLIFRKIEKGRLRRLGRRINIVGLIVMVIPVWAAAQVLNTPIICVYRFGLYGLVFLLGYCVFSHDEVIDVLKRWFLQLLVTAILLGTAFCIVNFGKIYADAPVNRTLLYAAFCWFTCLAVLGGMVKYGDVETRFTRWMGRRSFGLYVFHYLGISAVGLWIGRTGILPAVLVYMITLIAGFASGYVLNAVIARIPFFRWAVLGISGRKGKKNV